MENGSLVEFLKSWMPPSGSGILPGTLEWDAGLVLLAALHIGHRDRERLAATTGVPLARVLLFAERLEAGGVWGRDGTTDCPWFDDVFRELAFWDDIELAAGHTVRSIGADGLPSYEDQTNPILRFMSDC